jgi:hypothetical protein
MGKLARIGFMLLSATVWAMGRSRKASSPKRALASRRHEQERRHQEIEARRIADQSSQRYLMYFVVPAWAIVGALDWLWHRQTKIESTSGPQESVTHLLMMVEAGVPLLAGLFLETNAGLLRLMTGGMLLHQATVIWDVKYAVSRRKIPAREQHTHTFMETLPFDILAVFACLHPEQFLSMFGLGDEKPDFTLRWKRPGLPVSQIGAIFGAITVFVALPHVEEFVRCWRAYRRGLTGTETPECARELYAA